MPRPTSRDSVGCERSTSLKALAGFSEKERDQLFALLSRVNANLDRIAGQVKE
ncbi:hypothetical protein [Tahibacter soli]|uniref:Uncharacterized protein n=1 Tax=Tahibacter soli TaxID=2983605 RepID=A0A9X4BFE7_9GAMM|nr:hypothetical protein [Tahibacter soli]MDC8010935.1 hypothetical protein [Tahibacter soli]